MPQPRPLSSSSPNQTFSTKNLPWFSPNWRQCSWVRAPGLQRVEGGLAETHCSDRFRLRTFELLSKAYSSLPLTLAESYLGVSGSLILEGWQTLKDDDTDAKELLQRQAKTVGPTMPAVKSSSQRQGRRRRQTSRVRSFIPVPTRCT